MLLRRCETCKAIAKCEACRADPVGHSPCSQTCALLFLSYMVLGMNQGPGTPGHTAAHSTAHHTGAASVPCARFLALSCPQFLLSALHCTSLILENVLLTFGCEGQRMHPTVVLQRDPEERLQEMARVLVHSLKEAWVPCPASPQKQAVNFLRYNSEN